MALLRQLFVFGIVGTLGFLVDVAVLYAVSPLVGWHLGRLLSFWAPASTTWWFNRRFTFGSRRTDGPDPAAAGLSPSSPSLSVVVQYGKYLASMLGGGALNYAVYVATLHFYDAAYAATLGVALGSIAGLAVNFVSARFLVFRASAGGR